MGAAGTQPPLVRFFGVTIITIAMGLIVSHFRFFKQNNRFLAVLFLFVGGLWAISAMIIIINAQI